MKTGPAAYLRPTYVLPTSQWAGDACMRCYDSSQRVAAPAISLDKPPQFGVALPLECHHLTPHGVAQRVQKGGLRWGEGVGVEGAVGFLRGSTEGVQRGRRYWHAGELRTLAPQQQHRYQHRHQHRHQHHHTTATATTTTILLLLLLLLLCHHDPVTLKAAISSARSISSSPKLTRAGCPLRCSVVWRW